MRVDGNFRKKYFFFFIFILVNLGKKLEKKTYVIHPESISHDFWWQIIKSVRIKHQVLFDYNRNDILPIARGSDKDGF